MMLFAFLHLQYFKIKKECTQISMCLCASMYQYLFFRSPLPLRCKKNLHNFVFEPYYFYFGQFYSVFRFLVGVVSQGLFFSLVLLLLVLLCFRSFLPFFGFLLCHCFASIFRIFILHCPPIFTVCVDRGRAPAVKMYTTLPKIKIWIVWLVLDEKK